jgi:RNA polymerase-binding transcription factor DksA
MLSQEFIEEMKNKLLEEKERLSGELSESPVHTELGQDAAPDSNAQEVELDDVNADLRFRIQGDLEKIDKALGKIEAGTYGTDDEGAEISEERLRVIPWADQAI